MQAGMHEIAVKVIVHYNASASVVFVCVFIMVLILYKVSKQILDRINAKVIESTGMN
jgi:hypothetical protein